MEDEAEPQWADADPLHDKTFSLPGEVLEPVVVLANPTEAPNPEEPPVEAIVPEGEAEETADTPADPQEAPTVETPDEARQPNSTLEAIKKWWNKPIRQWWDNPTTLEKVLLIGCLIFTALMLVVL